MNRGIPSHSNLSVKNQSSLDEVPTPSKVGGAVTRVRPRTKRGVRIPELREAALRILQVLGKWSSELPVFKATVGNFNVLFTPHHILHQRTKVREEIKYLELLTGVGCGNLQYGIDIWRGPKVLNIEWDEGGSILVRSFRRGDWEEEFLGLAKGLKSGADLDGVGLGLFLTGNSQIC